MRHTLPINEYIVHLGSWIGQVGFIPDSNMNRPGSKSKRTNGHHIYSGCPTYELLTLNAQKAQGNWIQKCPQNLLCHCLVQMLQWTHLCSKDEDFSVKENLWFFVLAFRFFFFSLVLLFYNGRRKKMIYFFSILQKIISYRG